MFDVETVFVISSNRGDYVLNDLLSAIHWACSGGRSFFTVVVDETKTIEKLSAPGNYQILHSDLPPTVNSGFHRAAGVKWAIDRGIAYKQIILLTDSCLLTGQGLDVTLLQQTQRERVGLIGVRADQNSEQLWYASQTQLFNWQIPVTEVETPPITLCDDVLVMAGRLAGTMWSKGLLVPDGCHQWAGSYGAYAAWVCHLVGLCVISWGFETKPMPPFYVSHAQGQYLPPPHLLNNRFMVFAPATKVMSYSEADLRELYKQQRGEQAREIVKFQPVVTCQTTADGPA